MKVSKKLSTLNVNQMLKGIASALPILPLVMRRRRTPIAAYVLGGIGIAIVGSVAAVMLLSPRTRGRALGAAKDTYGRVNERVHNFRARGDSPMSNGLVDRSEIGSSNMSGL
jgi:hypothetical protein